MRSTFKANVLRFASFVPSVIVIISMVFIYGRRLLGISQQPVETMFQGILSYWLVLLLFSIFIVMALMVAFVFHAVVFNKKISSLQKLIWVIVLWVLNVIAIPIYYMKYLDNDHTI
ncbi:hypothetical protein KHM83_04385 [Fusibacter paucivorans]|uniref:Cardiolipin synthase N-terminal domain-containing protein n=1 Tax=Fusibacter paucivorans TaxID=76009 RepID=A0ABS5PL77_9FIRM|nr:hypothetical protein [Fusibacter paucivorans]MBS7525914.1 hypothetical protein [Fusibacter paucivorans]